MRRAMAIFLTVGIVGVAGALILNDVRGRSEITTMEAKLESTNHHLTEVNSQLKDVEAQENATMALRRTLAASSAEVQKSINDTNDSIASIDHGIVYAGFDVSALEACLTGVSEALDQLSTGGTRGGLSSLDSVSKSCAEAEQGTG